MDRLPAIICDLDGTLSDTTHRKHFVDKQPRDWDSFYNNLHKDPPVQWCLDMLEIYRQKNIKILLVTGRPQKYEYSTVKWLEKYGVKWDYLFFRENEDRRDDFVIKEEIYFNKIAGKFNVLFCLEDRKRVADMWRKLNITCLHVAEGDF